MNTGVCCRPFTHRDEQCSGCRGDQGKALSFIDPTRAAKDSVRQKRSNTMAKGLTKTALIRSMADATELPTKQVAGFLDLLAQTAVKETKKNGEFTIPGLGKLVKAERKARTGRNPQTGEAIKIKAKTVVKFRVAKAAKDAIAPVKAAAKK
jgi:DNA-binding protein HU-beta